MITESQRTFAIITGGYDPISDTGFYGFVPSSDLIDGKHLSELLEFHKGTDQNSHSGWLKFYIGSHAICNHINTHRIIYISRMTLKHTVSWRDIDRAKLRTGNRTVYINGFKYRVRLLTGGMDHSGIGSEWNELIYRVHAHYNTNKNKWGYYDDSDLSTSYGHGRFSWVQEKYEREAVGRGNYRVTSWNTSERTCAYPSDGWRPVLELIE